MAEFSPATGYGSPGLQALLQRPNHGTLDFLGFARGAAIADEMNWRDKVRSLDEDRLRRAQLDEMQERQARTYMASLLTNMQTAASAGVDPTDYFIQQREQMLADPAFQNMPAEVQHMVINRLGNSVALQMQALRNADDLQGIRRLADAYGLSTPVNEARLAGASGDFARQIEAVNRMYGSDIQLSPDGTTVSFNGMEVPAPFAVSALNAGNNRPEALLDAMTSWSMNSETQARYRQAMARSGLDEFGLPLGGVQNPAAGGAGDGSEVGGAAGVAPSLESLGVGSRSWGIDPSLIPQGGYTQSGSNSTGSLPASGTPPFNPAALPEGVPLAGGDPDWRQQVGSTGPTFADSLSGMGHSYNGMLAAALAYNAAPWLLRTQTGGFNQGNANTEAPNNLAAQAQANMMATYGDYWKPPHKRADSHNPYGQ